MTPLRAPGDHLPRWSLDSSRSAARSAQPDEVIFLKCYDTALDGRARYTGHTGFRNPECPADFVPRESIEARTVVVYDEARAE